MNNFLTELRISVIQVFDYQLIVKKVSLASCRRIHLDGVAQLNKETLI